MREIGLLTACFLSVSVFAARSHAEPKLIVVLGSSTAAGVGATSQETSWVGRLTAALAKSGGHVVINASVGGSDTQGAIDRFPAEVASRHPDFVVLATSFANEKATVPVSVTEQIYCDNILRLIAMVKGIGATPVVIGQYPNIGYGKQQKEAIQRIYRFLDDQDVDSWDFWNALADANGNWIPSLVADGTHPLDAGHGYMFDAIPLTFFDVGRKPMAPPQPSGAWSFSADGQGIDSPLLIALDRPARSWTQAVWVSLSRELPEAILSNDAGLAIWRANRSFQLVDAANNVLFSSDFNGIDQGPYHLCLTYDEPLGTLALYVNGVSSGGVGSLKAAQAGKFAFAGEMGSPEANCNGCAFAHPVVYRAALNASDASDLYGGRIPGKSLEAWLPLDQDPTAVARNAASTATAGRVSGSWRALRGEPYSQSVQALLCPQCGPQRAGRDRQGRYRRQ